MERKRRVRMECLMGGVGRGTYSNLNLSTKRFSMHFEFTAEEGNGTANPTPNTLGLRGTG